MQRGKLERKVSCLQIREEGGTCWGVPPCLRPFSEAPGSLSLLCSPNEAPQHSQSAVGACLTQPGAVRTWVHADPLQGSQTYRPLSSKLPEGGLCVWLLWALSGAWCRVGPTTPECINAQGALALKVDGQSLRWMGSHQRPGPPSRRTCHPLPKQT